MHGCINCPCIRLLFIVMNTMIRIYCFPTLEIVCEELMEPDNGLVLYSSDGSSPFGFETVGSYSCAEGYGLSRGNSERTCVGSVTGPGVWNGTTPSCEGTCCLIA